MENASKALIIAGAILLSILIIALGIYVFNMAKGSLKGDQLNEMEKNTFNSQFTEYEGKHPGSEVKSLVDKVISNYNQNSDEIDKCVNITIKGFSATGVADGGNTGKTDTAKMNAVRRALSDKHIYKVDVEIGNKGYVTDITIYFNP